LQSFLERVNLAKNTVCEKTACEKNSFSLTIYLIYYLIKLSRDDQIDIAFKVKS